VKGRAVFVALVQLLALSRSARAIEKRATRSQELRAKRESP